MSGRPVSLRTDLRKPFTLLYELPLLQVDVGEKAYDLAADCRRNERRHDAEARPDDRRPTPLDLGCDYRNGGRRTRRGWLSPIEPDVSEGRRRNQDRSDCSESKPRPVTGRLKAGAS